MWGIFSFIYVVMCIKVCIKMLYVFLLDLSLSLSSVCLSVSGIKGCIKLYYVSDGIFQMRSYGQQCQHPLTISDSHLSLFLEAFMERGFVSQTCITCACNEVYVSLSVTIMIRPCPNELGSALCFCCRAIWGWLFESFTQIYFAFMNPSPTVPTKAASVIAANFFQIFPHDLHLCCLSLLFVVPSTQIRSAHLTLVSLVFLSIWS